VQVRVRVAALNPVDFKLRRRMQEGKAHGKVCVRVDT
jgi:NADPH:quinone reductase-like Zn-dependent oxidoreductase